jgi:hypothetical protein
MQLNIEKSNIASADGGVAIFDNTNVENVAMNITSIQARPYGTGLLSRHFSDSGTNNLNIE